MREKVWVGPYKLDFSMQERYPTSYYRFNIANLLLIGGNYDGSFDTNEKA